MRLRLRLPRLDFRGGPNCDERPRAPGIIAGSPLVTTAWKISIVVSVMLAALLWAGRHRYDTALAQHLEQGKAYAAKQLELTGTLPPVLAESSGVAVSRAQPGVYWTHNDSGDRPNLYAIDAAGKLLATFAVAGAEARDWEDMAAGPCIAEAAPSGAVTPVCLYLADIGDNDRRWPWLTVYVVIEPRLDERTRTIASRSFRYRYPDGPDDQEAFAVLPDGDATIVSKGRSGTIAFFRLRRDAIARAVVSGEVLTAEYAGDSGIRPDAGIGRLVSGAAVSPDGTTLAVRTYYEVFFFSAVKDRDVVNWRGPGKPCFLGDAESQGEAITYVDRDTLLLTSERGRGAAGLIHRVRC